MGNSHQDSSSQASSLSQNTATLRVALIQICSTQDIQRNCDRAIERIVQAARRGARWVLLPENVCYIRREGDRLGWRESVDGEIIGLFRQAAREFHVYILLGSIPERQPDSDDVTGPITQYEDIS